MKSRQFVDRVTLHVLAGNGGNGCVSFRREKYVARGGPDGGDGGNGGNAILRADWNVESLTPIFYTPKQRADHGGHGKGKKLHGRNGKDLVIPVPRGTEVWDSDTGVMLYDLVGNEEEATVVLGGKGGNGNCHWKTSRHQAPREHTDGDPGESKSLRLEFKVVSDSGLVGYPNAGKSSLLTVISHAHPTIAGYPFTTLHPVVGTVMFEDYTSLTIADVPGLIDGAHEGVGLGHSFLRHIERAPVFLFVIDMAGTDGREPSDDYANLLNELKLHRDDMTERPSLVVANKMDVAAARKNVVEFRKKTGRSPIEISASTGEGIEELKIELRKLVAGSCSDAP